MKRRYWPVWFMAAGAALLAAGLVFLKAASGAQGVAQALPYLGVGVGCGLFGHGAGEWISRSAAKQNPEAARAMRIEKQDERNTAVINRAKAKALDVMIFVFGALNLALVLMGIDFRVTLLLVFAYLFVLGSAVYYHIRYNREM